MLENVSLSGGGVGVLLFPFYVRARAVPRALLRNATRPPNSHLKLVLLFSFVSIASPALLFLVSHHPSQTEVRVRELLLFVGCGVLIGENALFCHQSREKKTRENVFSFFFASRRSQTENIENIMYRYAPFFISNLLNASDGDESPDENCRRR
jgi:hypothetical protein